jgi:DNA-binding XRE family transcriptional regulator
MLKNRLKYWRHMKMMNQTEFAQFLGVQATQISLWERNKKQLTLESAWEIKKKLNCTLDELFEEAPE